MITGRQERAQRDGSQGQTGSKREKKVKVLQKEKKVKSSETMKKITRIKLILVKRARKK